MLADLVRNHFRQVDMGKNVGAGIHFAKSLDNFLAAAHADQPIVDDCDFHEEPSIGPAQGEGRLEFTSPPLRIHIVQFYADPARLRKPSPV